jgi:hypothetical protein
MTKALVGDAQAKAKQNSTTTMSAASGSRRAMQTMAQKVSIDWYVNRSFAQLSAWFSRA